MAVPKVKELHLKAICEPLGIIVAVKNFKDENLQKIFLKLRTAFIKSGKIIRITDYAKEILKIFLEDPDSFFEFVAKDRHLNAIADEIKETDGLQTEILMSMYESVTELYPQFKVQNLCSNVNDLSKGFEIDNLRTVQNSNTQPTENRFSVQNKGVISRESIQALLVNFRKTIFGQDHVISKVERSLKLISSGLSKRFSMFFIGQSGTGKTAVSKLIGDIFNGRFIKVNCNEYTHGHEHNKLVGAPPGYIGHSERSYLRDKAEISNKWVFLFDEIEKAHPKFFDFILTLMDEGTLIDNHGSQLDFSESIILFTSNQGMDEINVNPITFSQGMKERNILDSEAQVVTSMKKKFRPEFLNRIDEIVFFNNLSRTDVEKIAKSALAKHRIIATDELVDFVISGGYSVEYGAREINRFIKNNVLNVLSETILSGQSVIRPTYYAPVFFEGKLAFSMV